MSLHNHQINWTGFQALFMLRCREDDLDCIDFSLTKAGALRLEVEDEEGQSYGLVATFAGIIDEVLIVRTVNADDSSEVDYVSLTADNLIRVLCY